MKKSLEQQQKELDEKWKAFEKEKQTWEESTGFSNSQENVKEWVFKGENSVFLYYKVCTCRNGKREGSFIEF